MMSANPISTNDLTAECPDFEHWDEVFMWLRDRAPADTPYAKLAAISEDIYRAKKART